MTFDGERLQGLLRAYLATRHPDAMRSFAEAAKDACMVLLHAYLRRIRLRLTQDERAEVAHDALTRMLQVFLKDPTKGELPVAGRLYHEIRYRLHNPKEQRYQERTTALVGDVPWVPQLLTEAEDPMTFVQAIATDKDVDGRRIVVDLFSSRYYKTAIKKISTYTPKAWIYWNAVKLNTIFKLTRGEK